MSYGIDFASRSISSSPLVQAFTSRALAGAVESIFEQTNMFEGVYNALKQGKRQKASGFN
jgi:methyl coenzyme M reductase beta subunit